MAPDLAVKVANFCSALEALFSSGETELTHKLSERVACFLSDDPADRWRTYRDLKAAYSIRSKTVHGDRITKGRDTLDQTTEKLDSLLRKILRRILEAPALQERFMGQEPKDMRDYFLGLVLGVPRA